MKLYGKRAFLLKELLENIGFSDLAAELGKKLDKTEEYFVRNANRKETKYEE